MALRVMSLILVTVLFVAVWTGDQEYQERVLTARRTASDALADRSSDNCSPANELRRHGDAEKNIEENLSWFPCSAWENSSQMLCLP